VSSLAQVSIHSSQFPENVRKDLLNSLRSRQVNHKFHYESLKQVQKWLAIHQAYSPARTEPGCSLAYDLAFEAAASRIVGEKVHLIGLGCGGGEKDKRLLQLLGPRAKELFYTPSDVSLPMVLVARKAALSVLPESNCSAFICDLAATEDLTAVIEQGSLPFSAQPARARTSHPVTRLVTFFGMIPNFEPREVLPRLASLIRANDYLLFSANLAPGDDYEAGVRRILPQYDNQLTRDWLLTFLLDLGVEKQDGVLSFSVESNNGLKRVAAYFRFRRPRSIQVESEEFEFQDGESIRLFFSYRYTTKLVQALLAEHGISVLDQRLSSSQEEGVFLCQRATLPG